MDKTTANFKVGDHVHVDHNYAMTFGHYIRARITGINNYGYLLTAFKKDLPGIYMGNIWDKDLVIRKGKARMYLNNNKQELS
jgi:hypothetical protein